MIALTRQMIFGLMIAALIASSSQTARAETVTSPASADGFWDGAIAAPGSELQIQIHLIGSGESWTGTINIPAQGLNNFELSNIGVDGDDVHFEMSGVPGEPTFDGKVSGDTLAGDFTQGPHAMKFSLERFEEPAPEPPAAALEAVPGTGLNGEWGGSLDVGPMDLRLALHVEDDGAGKLEAVLDSLDQNAKIAVDTVSLSDGHVTLVLKSIGASFEGVMNSDGSAIDGSWSQGGRNMELTFNRLAERMVLDRPQTPKEPFPYKSRDVSFENQAAGIKLAGTLVTPDGSGPFPAVIMITGSGPQDRDESLMGHKPFLVIADHLARHGIASLRYDDRGFAASQGNHMGSTVADFTTDAGAALDFLAAQPKIDQQALGVVGHSEGGLTGPRLAVTDARLDFLVLLAPPAEPLDALLARQSADILRAKGIDDGLIARLQADQKDELAMVVDESLSAQALTEKLRARIKLLKDNYTQEELDQLEVSAATLEAGIATATTPWFRSLLREDPAVHLRQIRIPVLALFAEKDLQVAAEVNARILQSALAKAGNQDADVHILPGLNHLFQHSETGRLEEYGELTETFAPEALDAIEDWIVKRFSGKSGKTSGEN